MVQDNYNKKKKKEFVIVALACFICLSALVLGTTMIKKKGGKSEKDTSNIINLNETTDKLSEEKSGDDEKPSDGLAVDGNVSNVNDNNITEESTTQKKNYSAETKAYTSNENGESNSLSDDNSVNVSGNTSDLKFGKESKLAWPVQGNVILDYNMENTIYFPTLNAYKCNPAIIIQGEAGTSVMAGVSAVVKTVDMNDEIGNYVILSLGDDYELTLGQLENIELKAGDTVNADTCIGVIANPTRYFTKEGSNLYYKLTKSGEPCDPLDYLS